VGLTQAVREMKECIDSEHGRKASGHR
jgi:hypothetical protein